MISGEAGVGKTSLVEELSRRGSVARMLWGQCDPLQTPRALGPVLDVARAAGGDLAKLAESDDRHQLFAEFLAVCSGRRTADGGRARGSPLGGCRHPRLPRVRGPPDGAHARRARRDVSRRPGARSSAAYGAGRSRDGARDAKAQARATERECRRDARGVDSVGSDRGAAPQWRRSVRGDRAHRRGPGRPDVGARHRARPRGAAERRRSASSSTSSRCFPKAPMRQFSRRRSTAQSPRSRRASSRDCSCTTVGPWPFATSWLGR